jgi:hypothetical protein
MNKIEKLLADQNTNFNLRELRVKNLNSSVANKIIAANSKEIAMKILRNYRSNYDTIRMM